ncbi:TIGR03085 family metal-binding protein [Actinoplanes sp. NPDC051494]|uniref:TIGR03085 family metal-binding protein n=1 Tax=Actinoplanes sp. NPDC051494 TaxID=3363907 RepID=UPI0037A37228
MTDFARTERHLLADSLLAAGPDAPTCCEGWTTRDLAAHVVVRERRPDTAAGSVVPALAGHAEKVRAAKTGAPYPAIVEELRNPPAWSPIPLVDRLTNGTEFFIHHEDVRRAQPGWEPRPLDKDFELALWKGVKLTSRMTLRPFQPVRIEAPGHGVLQIGDGEPTATLTGAPGELVLFLSGRQRVSRVEVTGDQSLRTAKLGR